MSDGRASPLELLEEETPLPPVKAGLSLQLLLVEKGKGLVSETIPSCRSFADKLVGC